MNYQKETEVLKLKQQVNHINTQLNLKEESHNKQVHQLMQKMQLLYSELSDYRQKQMGDRRLNESILQTYKQNESFREHNNQQAMDLLKTKHQQEMTKIKHKFQQEQRRKEEELQILQRDNLQFKTLIEQTKFDFEKKLIEHNNQWEQKMVSREQDLTNIFNHRLQIAKDNLRQTQDICKMYEEHFNLEMPNNPRELIKNRQLQVDLSKKLYKNTVQQQNVLQMKREGKEIKVGRLYSQDPLALSLKVNRILAQSRSSNSRIDLKIRDIVSRN